MARKIKTRRHPEFEYGSKEFLSGIIVGVIIGIVIATYLL